MKKGLFFIIFLASILVACPNGPLPITEELAYCQVAETHLKQLGCIPSDRPYTIKGKSFTQFCQETMMNGVNLSPKCLSQIQSCNQMNTCIQ